MSGPREADIAEWIMGGGADGLNPSALVRAITENFPGVTIGELKRGNEIADELYTVDEIEREQSGG